VIHSAIINFDFVVVTGYASSSAGGAGLYNSNTYAGQNYGSKYPYSNAGYAGAGGAGGAFPFVQPFAPLPGFASPFDFQNAYQQYFNQLSSLNAKYGSIIQDFRV
jgi:hypothetical protein